MPRFHQLEPAGIPMRLLHFAALFVAALAITGAVFFVLSGGDGVRRSPPSVTLTADLDVDTDRNGVVNDADEEGEDEITAARGAFFAVNYDADGGRRDAGGRLLPDTLRFSDRTGQPTGLDDRIENEADRDGIAPLVIRSPGAPLPPGVRVWLRAAEREDAESILVYARREPGARAIWGGLGSREGLDPIPTEIDITRYVDPASPDFAGTEETGDLTFAVEGLFFRNDPAEASDSEHGPPLVINPFDGDIDLFLEIRNEKGRVLSSDHVRMRVTPWLALPNSHESLAVFARAPDELDGENAALIEPEEAGYAGLAETGQFVPVRGMPEELEEADTDFRWLQDHAVLGAWHLPGTGPEQRTYAALRLPYEVDEDFGQPAWVARHMTGAQSGVFQFGSWLGNDHGAQDRAGGGHGGNIGVVPPSATWPLGRIVIGDTMPAGLRVFLKSQRVQPLMTLPTQWLAVGHVDEMVNFTGRGGETVIADPALAWRLLEAIPEEKRGAAVFFARGGAPVAGTVRPSAGELSETAQGRRLDTGIDHRGTDMRYVRIYRDSGSGAAGQVARIAPGGLRDGHVLIDRVWMTATRVLPRTKDEFSVLHLMGLVEEDEEAEETDEPETEWLFPPEPGDRFVMVRDTKFWHEDAPALITVEEVLADERLRKLNTQNIAARMASVRARLRREGGRNADGTPFVKVTGAPVIFAGLPGKNFVKARSAAGFTPNAVNFQPAAGRLYLPRQFGPLDEQGRDVFEKALREALGEGVRFVDTWDAYHSQFGEVHCATNVLRRHFDLDWWKPVAKRPELSRRVRSRPAG
ncbi:MAG: protein-arginine deiminase family protein [Alphaproteobacteria bacterium]